MNDFFSSSCVEPESLFTPTLVLWATEVLRLVCCWQSLRSSTSKHVVTPDCLFSSFLLFVSQIALQYFSLLSLCVAFGPFSLT